MKNKKILYVSPSIFPSKSANSVHVINQCRALAKCNKVVLVCGRSLLRKSDMKTEVETTYGSIDKNLEIVSSYIFSPRGIAVVITFMALVQLLNFKIKYVVISRNLYFSMIMMLFKRQAIYETHLVEFGLQGLIQKMLLACPSTKCVVISKALKDILLQKYPGSKSNIVVLHDAANVIENGHPFKKDNQLPSRNKDFWSSKVACDTEKYDHIVGYFGHLYKGRGVEDIILPAAEKMVKTFFVIVGGNEAEIELHQKIAPSNVYFCGYQPHKYVQEAMKYCDVLLMPYQHQVSIGIPHHDTSKWMSPLKMFEYMSSGRPIISSDLPVLREVLDDERNALMVDPKDNGAWVRSIERLVIDKALGERLANNARSDIDAVYNWSNRANALINLFSD